MVRIELLRCCGGMAVYYSGMGWAVDRRMVLRFWKFGLGLDPNKWDTHALLSVMLGHWQEVFSGTLGRTERTLVHELLDVRSIKALSLIVPQVGYGWGGLSSPTWCPFARENAG